MALTGPAERRALKPLDRLDRERVDAAGLGELERDEVAEHHRPEQARDAGLARGLDPDRLGAGRGDRLRGQLEAAALARVLVGVLEQDGGEPRAGAGARPAADLVVVGLGQLGEEGGQLRVLVDLGLPAARDRRGQVGAVDDRQRARRARRRSRRRGPGGRRPAPRGTPRRRRSRCGCAARRRPGRRPRPRRRACRRPRRAAAGEPGQADHRARRPRARRSTRAPPVLATMRRAPSASAAAKQASVSSVSPE